jgi:thiol:disulfide interchange protein
MAWVLGLACSGVACGKTRANLTFRTDGEIARVEARALHKPLLLWIDATWDNRGLERFTFPDQRVITAVENGQFTTAYLDVSDDELPSVRSILDRYRVQGVPTLIVFDAEGREVQRWTEHVRPEVLVPSLRAAAAHRS